MYCWAYVLLGVCFEPFDVLCSVNEYSTLKEETFAVSRFLAKSAKVYSPRNFLKKVVICEYSEKNTHL